MTLVIACALFYHFEMEWWWYVTALGWYALEDYWRRELLNTFMRQLNAIRERLYNEDED